MEEKRWENIKFDGILHVFWLLDTKMHARNASKYYTFMQINHERDYLLYLF